MSCTHHCWAGASEGDPRETSLPTPGRHHLSWSFHASPLEDRTGCSAASPIKPIISLTEREEGGSGHRNPRYPHFSFEERTRNLLLLKRYAPAPSIYHASICDHTFAPGGSFLPRTSLSPISTSQGLTQMLPPSGSFPRPVSILPRCNSITSPGILHHSTYHVLQAPRRTALSLQCPHWDWCRVDAHHC